MDRVEIIDCEIDPTEVRRENRRRVVRYGLPIASIVLIAAGLIASTLFTGAMNKADVLELSRNLIDTLNERVLTEVRAYQAPARDAVDSLAAALPEDPWSEVGRSVFERIARESLRSHPQIAALYIGTASGDFLMVTRNQAGSTDTKLIRNAPGGPKAIWTRRDAKDRITATEIDEDDRFDPRARPWYRDAAAAGGVAWSSVYIFFTSRSPGITVSRPDRQGGKTPRAVIGADIRLDSLSNFLRDLQNQARDDLNGKAPGSVAEWKNDKTGNSGTVKLIRNYTWQGHNCRQVVHAFKVKNEQPQQWQTNLCLMKNGAWKWPEPPKRLQ